MKNKLILAILVAVCVLLTASMVSAALTVTSTLDAENPTFGGSSQRASNPDHDDQDDREVYDTGSVTVKNDGTSDVTVTSISVTIQDEDSMDLDLQDVDITLENPVTIPKDNNSADVTLKARITEKLHAVDDKGKAKAFRVAKVTLKDASETSLVTFTIYMRRENKLHLDKLYVTSEENDHKSYDDSEKVKDLKPGDDVEIEIKVESQYDDKEEVKIEDVTAYIEIEGDLNIDADDTEVEVSSDLGPEEEAEETTSFDVDEDIDDDTYDGEVYVTGEDEHGARHGEHWDMDWEVEKETHELTFTKVELSRSTLECGQTSTQVEVKVQNRGKKDEKDTYLYVRNSDLNIDIEHGDFEIEESDSWSRTFTLALGSDIEPGNYDIRTMVYYSGDEDDGVLGDLKDLTLTIKSCSTSTTSSDSTDSSSTSTTTSTPASEVVVLNEPTTTLSGSIQDVPPEIAEELGFVETKETSFLDTRAFDVILVSAVVIAFGTFVFMLGKLFTL